MSQIEAKKGEVIQRSGDLNSKVYFVHKGLLRDYSIDEKVREHILSWHQNTGLLQIVNNQKSFLIYLAMP